MKFLKDKKGVFGLNAIQSFFAIILSLALLGYVIVIIMGTLSSSQTQILTNTGVLTAVNESVTFTSGNAAQTLTVATEPGAHCIAISSATNATATGAAIGVANYTLTTSCTVLNATAILGYQGANPWNASYTQYLTYTYTKYSTTQNQLDQILANTSNGITGFFTSINPVYAILAVLVIILVLVVLVRVVQAPNRNRESLSL